MSKLNVPEVETVGYVVKYALTAGIQKVKGRVQEGLTLCPMEGSTFDQYAFHGKQWSPDPEGALRLAERARVRKIASLKKQIAQLEALQFVIPEDFS